jgi:hypothetical protein
VRTIFRTINPLSVIIKHRKSNIEHATVGSDRLSYSKIMGARFWNNIVFDAVNKKSYRVRAWKSIEGKLACPEMVPRISVPQQTVLRVRCWTTKRDPEQKVRNVGRKSINLFRMIETLSH